MAEIHRQHTVAVHSDFCAVAPSPELRERMQQALDRVRTGEGTGGPLSLGRTPHWLGFDDGTILPPDQFPAGTPLSVIRSAAADRAPLQGAVRVVVVLANFSDTAMAASTAHFEELFFSVGTMADGSVRDYYREVTHGLVDIVGTVVGPVTLPQTQAWYANGNFGIGRPTGVPRANIMAQDAAVAANPLVDLAPFDNDGNGFVDAFIVVHPGTGGESSGNSGDIWSHKWTLPSTFSADGTKVLAYLTIPEDARIGVSAHELGHLLFGFPDLYDTDGTSEGIGNWCLMAGGSWGGAGNVPVHPSAWCKVTQGWASTTNVSSGGALSVPDVKSSNAVHRLWKDGAAGTEYFLMENRQRTGFDRSLPADGLLVWHVDENQPGNTDENHYKVALLQADGNRDMELAHNRGDAGDPYPGSSGVTSLNGSTTPNTRSYAGADTCVSLTSISAPAATMTVTVAVSCGKALVKDLKDGHKDLIKDKDFKDGKEPFKDTVKDLKEPFKERKDGKEQFKDFKEPFKERKDTREGKPFVRERPFDPPFGSQPDADPMTDAILDLQTRLAVVEQAIGGGEPFIGTELRPDVGGAPGDGPQLGGDASTKRELDTPGR